MSLQSASARSAASALALRGRSAEAA